MMAISDNKDAAYYMPLSEQGVIETNGWVEALWDHNPQSQVMLEADVLMPI